MARVVVVTGAGAGVGRAMACEFARQGCDVGLLARDAERLEAAAEEVRGLGACAFAVPTDVADSDAVEAAADRIEQQLGPIEIWVNNAMVTVFAPVLETDPAEFRRATEVTYLGTVHGTITALKRMRRHGRGTIVNVGSALAYRSVPPIYQPEVPARAIVFAAFNPRREFWIGFPTVIAILANRIAPSLADRYLATHGYEGQLTDEPTPADAPANLYRPVPGPYGAHGRFNAQARETSWEVFSSRHRNLATAVLLIGGFAGLHLLARRLRI